MVPDQCCEKIDCIYSYMGLNHGTRFTESDLNSQATWAGAENRMAASKIVNEKRNNL